jgi:hypothetical protein
MARALIDPEKIQNLFPITAIFHRIFGAQTSSLPPFIGFSDSLFLHHEYVLYCPAGT